MTAPRTWSLAARLTAWYTGLGFVVVFGACLFLYWGLIQNLQREDDRTLGDLVHVLRVLLKEHPEDEEAFRQEIVLEMGARKVSRIYARVLNEDGSLFAETPGMSEALPSSAFSEPSDPGTAPEAGKQYWRDGRPFRTIAARGYLGDSQSQTKVIQVALDWSHKAGIVGKYRNQLFVVSLAALLGCLLVGYQVARRAIRPVEQIAETARRIRSTTLHERIQQKDFPRELFDLSSNFNEMFDRLENSFARLSRFSADLAHELRTPIANLRGEMEVALSKDRNAEEYRSVIESALDECGRVSRIIESLLFLARAEGAQTKIQTERIDLAAEIQTVRDFYHAAAREKGIALEVSPTSSGTALLDRVLFQRALGNLIENAMKFTSAGGRIAVESQSSDGVSSVVVSDSGCGIAAKDLPFVFDRFFKADLSRAFSEGGAGLGLAIVKSIVEMHGGSVTIQSEEGRGTRVTLQFSSPASLPS